MSASESGHRTAPAPQPTFNLDTEDGRKSAIGWLRDLHSQSAFASWNELTGDVATLHQTVTRLDARLASEWNEWLSRDPGQHFQIWLDGEAARQLDQLLVDQSETPRRPSVWLNDLATKHIADVSEPLVASIRQAHRETLARIETEYRTTLEALVQKQQAREAELAAGELSEREKKSLDFTVELSKQLLTLAAAITAFSIAFANELVDVQSGQAYPDGLVFAWALFFLSIAAGVQQLIAASRQVSVAPQSDSSGTGLRAKIVWLVDKHAGAIQTMLFVLGLLAVLFVMIAPEPFDRALSIVTGGDPATPVPMPTQDANTPADAVVPDP
jgi:hypothetical protein